MRLVLLLAIVALPAHADLYRWIDPETGSVKISTLPPSDATQGTDVIPYRNPAAPKPAPAAEVKAKPAPAASSLDALQVRWSDLLTRLSGVTPQDFAKGGEGIKQHLETYEAVRAELDRLDPAGAARRQAESMSIFDKVKQGFAAQFGATPAGQK